MAKAVTRTKRAVSLGLAGLMLAGSGPLPAAGAPQAPAPTPSPATASQPPVFGLQTTAVVVDVVVRDKKGRLVRDLGPGDFEVYEDGARQTVDSFRVVDNHPPEPAEATPAPKASAPAGSAPAPAAPPAEPPAPAIIAFVFDRLSANGRAMAEKSALTYVERGHVGGDLVAVFSLDLALRTLQPFTNDLDAVKTAVKRAASQGNTAFSTGENRESARQRADSVNRADDALNALGGGGSGAAANQAQAGAIAAQQAYDRAQLNMLRTFDALERDQQGFATTNGLLAVVNGLKAVPGRKTIVFFSEGLAIPANVQARFRDVIASANRANVSIYAVDAGGLRVESGLKEARDEIVQAARDRAAQEATGRDAMGGSMTARLERNEDLLRLSPESGLGQLASETGGFLVNNTNDASRGFGHIAEDMRFYYLVSYAPSAQELDGRFRTITVKVNRPNMRVQTRKGYFAVRPETALPVRSYEGPALAQLDRQPAPHAFPLHATVLSFPEASRPGLAPVYVELPGGAVAWVPERGSGFSARFSVVVRIKDQQGREADRVSQDYVLSTPADKLENARRGSVLFYREANVPPGRYTAEAVAYDLNAQAASVHKTTFEVPAVEEARARVSSLVLVNRAEKLEESERQSGNPMHFGEAILYPSLGLPFRKSAQPAIGFYFAVYGAKDAPPARNASIEVRQGAKVVASTTAALAAPDTGGRIQHAGTLPLAGFSPGTYTLKVSVAAGPSVETREAPFEVVE
jgi:VWFA-related protein